jgi:hypothetical protein
MSFVDGIFITLSVEVFYNFTLDTRLFSIEFILYTHYATSWKVAGLFPDEVI